MLQGPEKSLKIVPPPGGGGYRRWCREMSLLKKNFASYFFSYPETDYIKLKARVKHRNPGKAET
jgi:hypothetical protein